MSRREPAAPLPSSVDRAMGSAETLYWLLDQLYCLNFVVFAELQGRLDPLRLQAALATVQEEQPLLRVRIAPVGGRARFRPVSREAAPLQVQALGLRHWRREIEQQLQQRFEPGQAPLARCLWFKGTGRKAVLAMCFHHAIADGRSGMTVLLDVLRRATVDGAPPRYRPARESSQSLDRIRHKLPVLGALQGLRFWINKGREALQFPQQLPGYDPTARADRRVRTLSHVLPRAVLADLLTRSRQQRTTLHGALGAALLLALNDQFERVAPRSLALNSLADLRGVLDAGLTDQGLGLYVSTLCTVHAVGSQPDFWALAREIRTALKEIIDAGDANLIHGVYPASPVLAPGQSVARLVQVVVALGPPASMLTNIGRIDDVALGDTLAVQSLAFVVSPPAQHPICVTAASYGGRLFVNLLYDEHKLRAAQRYRHRRCPDRPLAGGGRPGLIGDAQARQRFHADKLVDLMGAGLAPKPRQASRRAAN
jgi:NRPS condensation-like uncharacterized protein